MSRFLDLVKGIDFESDPFLLKIRQELRNPVPREAQVDSRSEDRAKVSVTEGGSKSCPACGSRTTPEQLFCAECNGFLGQIYTEDKAKSEAEPSGTSLADKQRGRFESRFSTLRRWLKL